MPKEIIVGLRGGWKASRESAKVARRAADRFPRNYSLAAWRDTQPGTGFVAPEKFLRQI